MDISRRKLLKAIGAASVGGVTGAAAYGALYERSDLVVTRRTLDISRLPTGLAGLTIGVLTDVHRSLWVSEADVREACRRLQQLKPDLIVLGGDYVSFSDRRFIEPAADALASLHAPEGVFAVLGNHDDEREVPAALVRKGIEVLRDARTRRVIRHEPVELVGIRYWTRRATDIAHAARGASGPVILLAHDPRRLIEASALGIPLVVSGHTHGGQVVLPVVGAIAARKFPVVAGDARLGDTHIFVSRGIGTVYLPVRLNCPPEVALLTLRPTTT